MGQDKSEIPKSQSATDLFAFGSSDGSRSALSSGGGVGLASSSESLSSGFDQTVVQWLQTDAK
jgi:hypothetical protein